MLEGFLHKVYEGFDTSSDIEPTAWREVLRIMNEASVEGIIESGYTTHEESFLENIRHSNEVFSAFKVHSMGVKMAERLHDEQGHLRSFEEWKASVRGIASHQVGSWLRTEYDTAVLRAHQASDWQEFERNRDILPNLRWMPTTSPSPDTLHESFWARALTLPIDDPFWMKNHPGNRWNCKCSLEATDDPATVEEWRSDKEVNKETAQAGLENNPRDGRIFSDKHPYFPKSCGACPFYKAKGGFVRNLLGRIFENQEKDCHNCQYVDGQIATAKYSKNYQEFLQLKEDKNYIEVEFDPKSGGVRATHRGHKKKGNNQTYFGEEKKTSYDLEKECVEILFKSGHSVIFLDEKNRAVNGDTLSALNISVDGISMDIRSITKNKDNYVNALTAKDSQLQKYNARNDISERANRMCIFFHDSSMFSDSKMRTTINSYNNISAKKAVKEIETVIVVVRNADEDEGTDRVYVYTT